LGHGLKLWIPVIAVAVLSVSIISISAEESLIPAWIKNTASFWVQGDVSDKEFISAIEWMIENDFIRVSSSKQKDEYMQNQLDLYKSEYHKLEIENEQLKSEIKSLEEEIDQLISSYENLDDYSQNYYEEPQYYPTEPEIDYSQYCYGYAECFMGTVTEIVDGDTIKVDGKSIRFALVNTPEYGETGYSEAKKFIEQVCPVGSAVLVDEDDYQTEGSYGRMLALVWCQKSQYGSAINLNEQILGTGLAEILTSFCSQSEFEYTEWAQKYGCGAKTTTSSKYESPKYTPPESEPPESTPKTTQQSCDSSYPTVCIPPPPPDLDCGEISFRNFKVLQPDPHRFDGDKDGIGCES
jgi:micrococcal nuclease